MLWYDVNTINYIFKHQQTIMYMDKMEWNEEREATDTIDTTKIDGSMAS